MAKLFAILGDIHSNIDALNVVMDDCRAQGVTDFLTENGYSYPVVMDTEGELMQPYFITAFPTTFMIDTDGNIYGYVTGSISREIMEDIIEQTREASGLA